MRSDMTAQSEESGTRFGKGRPRDGRIDAAVLAAVRELLVEVGYPRLTVADVATRAGTAKTAIYRRWSGKPDLVHDAVFGALTTLNAPSGHIVDDIAAMVETVRVVFNSPITRAALPGLVADMSNAPTLHRQVLAAFGGVFGDFRRRLGDAVDAGEVRENVDPDDVIEMMGGSALLHILLHPDDMLGQQWAQGVVSMLTGGIVAR